MPWFTRCPGPNPPGVGSRRTAGKTLAVASCALLLPLWGCDLPRDPENTLDSVRGAVLSVGVSEAPPWVTRGRGEEPTGIEPALVRSFAERLDAKVRWVWGTPADHVAALERFELDLVAGGHTLSSPLVHPVASTAAWYVTTERRGQTRVKKLRHVFLAPPGENGWILWLDRRLRADTLLIRSLTGRLDSVDEGTAP